MKHVTYRWWKCLFLSAYYDQGWQQQTASSRAMLTPPSSNATSPKGGRRWWQILRGAWTARLGSWLTPEPIWNTLVLALPPTCIPPSRPLKTYGFEIPFPLNPYFPKDLSHHPCTGSSFPSKEVTHRYPKHRPAQRVTVQTKGTHIAAVRPTAGSQSRQLYLYIYPHVFIYKMLNIRRLNYSYWSEMVCKNFISSIYLHTH